MKLRKITSLTALISFILLLITSIILYIVPQGRVAYWADWHLWGLNKTQWGEIHINLGVLFILAMGLHIYYNWSMITAYLKNRKKEFKLFTPDFNAALAITLGVVLGTYFLIPPFSTLLDLSQAIKDKAALTYGEPPYGHAELSSLKILVQKTNIPLDHALKRLSKNGIDIQGPDQTILDMARKNHISPKQVFDILSPEAIEGRVKELPLTPPPGTGNKSLAALCLEFGTDKDKIIKILGAKGIPIDPNLPLKQVAQGSELSPVSLYDIIREASLTE